MMHKAGLSSCCEHFHLLGGTQGGGQLWMAPLVLPAQQHLGKNAKKDLEHCSRGTAGESQETSQFLAGFEAVYIQAGWVKCVLNAQKPRKSDGMRVCMRKKG